MALRAAIADEIAAALVAATLAAVIDARCLEWSSIRFTRVFLRKHAVYMFWLKMSMFAI